MGGHRHGAADARLPHRRATGRHLSDRFGARLFATSGLIVSGGAFLLLELLPINFSYVWFALLIFLFAVGMGLFFSPNQAAVMNSLPPEQRGAGAGMVNTFQISATVLSMGLFFTIVTLGLAAACPPPVQGPGQRGCRAVRRACRRERAADREPVLRVPRLQSDQGTARPDRGLQQLCPSQQAYVTGRTFFPKLIEQPFASGLHLAFTFAAIVTAVAIIASALRGQRYLHATEPAADELADGAAEIGGITGFVEPLASSDADLPADNGHGNGRAAGPSRASGAAAQTWFRFAGKQLSGVGTTAHRRDANTAPAAGSPAAAGEPLLGIGAAAARAGVSERALRYYQQLGLLPRPAPRPGGCAGTPRRTWPGWPASGSCRPCSA